jgi:ABC-type transporter Mla subunit MlaD
MHLELAPPVGHPATGHLAANSRIPLDRSMTYPSTEQTLAALSSVVNAGGLGQLGDIIHSLNATFSGNETEIRRAWTPSSAL